MSSFRGKVSVSAILLILLSPFLVAMEGAAFAGLIPKTNWQLWYVDSEETVRENAVAEHAFDGVSGTLWHTQYNGSSPPPPHEIQIDLGGNYTIEGFRYLPRQDGGVNGGIAKYEFYVSADGLSWGTAVATGTFAKATTEKEVLFPGKPGRFVRLRALSEINGKAWTSVAELNVLGSSASTTVLPKTNWQLWYVDSEETVRENAVAEHAFDGVSGTLWHTQYNGSSPPPPHEIQIDLGGNYTVQGFRYLPRQDGGVNGGIAKYEFYVSADGLSWGTAVATGTFAKATTEKEVLFPGKPGRFVRLRALSEINGKAWTSVAELNVLGSSASGNQAPNGVIVTPSTGATIQAGGSVTFTGTGTDPDGSFPLRYSWRFGAGSGIPDSTLEDPGAIQFNNPGVFTVTFTVTDSLGLADSTPATRTITVTGGSSAGLIPRTNFRVVYVDSEETVSENGAARNAIDGSSGSIWHTQWSGSSPPPPHEIQIDLGGNYTVQGFRYLPRGGTGYNGVIAQYEFYVSADGLNWGSAVATGTFAKTKTEKEVSFPGKPGRFVRLRALSEVNGNPWTSAAEIRVLGTNIVSGFEYVAIGDSITEGIGDNISSDGIGFEPILANLLSTTVANEGVAGVTSAYGASIISDTLSKYPSAKYYLVLYGTNDANVFINTPSGMGKRPGDSGYDGSFKDNLQQIIWAIKNSGKIPYLAMVPYTLDTTRISTIMEYNVAIDELWVDNGITVPPPDLFPYFQTHQGEFADALHPNGQGYQSMANLWKAVIAP